MHCDTLHCMMAACKHSKGHCTIVSCCAAVQEKMAADTMLWAQRPICEDLLRYAAEDVQQLLILADKITIQLGTSQLTLLSALSALYSQSYWDAADQDAAASCVKSFPTQFLPAKSAVWIADLFHKAHPANPFTLGLQSLRR